MGSSVGFCYGSGDGGFDQAPAAFTFARGDGHLKAMSPMQGSPPARPSPGSMYERGGHICDGECREDRRFEKVRQTPTNAI